MNGSIGSLGERVLAQSQAGGKFLFRYVEALLRHCGSCVCFSLMARLRHPGI
jgi:hypothetical protein